MGSTEDRLRQRVEELKRMIRVVNHRAAADDERIRQDQATHEEQGRAVADAVYRRVRELVGATGLPMEHDLDRAPGPTLTRFDIHVQNQALTVERNNAGWILDSTAVPGWLVTVRRDEDLLRHVDRLLEPLIEAAVVNYIAERGTAAD